MAIEEGLAKLRAGRERGSADETHIYDDLIHQFERWLAVERDSDLMASRHHSKP